MTRRSFVASASTALSQSRIAGANERIRMGIIGAGERGSYHASRLARLTQTDVVSICDVYRLRAESARARSNPQAALVQDYRRVLDRKDIDAVVISVSDHKIKDEAELDFLQRVVDAGGSGAINVSFRYHKGGYISVQGDAVVIV